MYLPAQGGTSLNKNYLPTGKDVTEFNPQLQHFDYVCGQVMKENRLLRFVVIISVLSFLLSIAISIYAVNRPKSIPVLVTMNDFGETRYIGEVSGKNYQNYTVPEIAIQYQIKDFVSLYNTLSTDGTIMKKSVDKIYHMLTATTASKYTSLIRENNPFEDFGDFTKEVFFDTEPLKLSNNVYQLDYTIVTRQLTGEIYKQNYMRAVISVNLMQPSQEDVKENPLGIYITNFDFQSINKNKIQ